LVMKKQLTKQSKAVLLLSSGSFELLWRFSEMSARDVIVQEFDIYQNWMPNSVLYANVSVFHSPELVLLAEMSLLRDK
jgi:hypothetical protein